MSETLINGYHVLQLGSREPTETISMSVIENELGEGYTDQVLYGSQTGLRSFGWQFPALDMNTRSCTLDGVALKPAQYLYELFMRQKRDGTYFAVQSPVNNQYYLCKFADNNLTYNGIYAGLFSGSAMFKQVRVSGVSVFDVSKIDGVWAEYYFPSIAQSDNTDFTSVSDATGNGHTASILGSLGSVKPKYRTAQQNGLGVGRWTDAGGSQTWELFCDTPLTFYWALCVAKYSAASFASYAGAVTALTTNTIFTGNNGGGVWYNQSYTNEYYWYNGIAYAPTAKTAPLGEFGISFMQVPGGVSMDGIQIGRDRNFGATRTWKGDIGHIIIGSSPIGAAARIELIEHVKHLWAL